MWAEEHDVFLHCRNVDKVRLRYSLEFEDTAALTACIDCLHCYGRMTWQVGHSECLL